MAHELSHLQTLVTNLLPSPYSVSLTKVTMKPEYVLLQLTTTNITAACPCCAVSSSSIHSRYQRSVTDLTWGTCTVRIQLKVRKFVCRNPHCERRIFTERLPELVAAYARKTRRLITVLRAIGMALGGNAGARLAAGLRLPTSPVTLRITVSWTCCRTAQPQPLRRGWLSIPPSLWSAAIGVASMPTAFARGHLRPCRS
jgi:transposase